MKRVYLLFGAIVAMSICDLFFIRRSTETLQIWIMVGLFLLYLVCLIMLFFKKGVTLRWKFLMAGAALLTMSVYFKTHELRNKAAFHIAFAMHQQGYTEFAKMINHKSDSLVKVMRAGGAEKIWSTEVFDALTKDKEVEAMRAQTGVRWYTILDAKKGDQEVDGKFVPEFTLINAGNTYGLQYNPDGYITDFSPSAQSRIVTRHDSDWQFWEAKGGGFGGFM